MTHFSILSIHCVYDIQTSILPHTNMCKKQALIQLYRCFDVNELFSEIISCCLILEKNEIIFLTFFYQLSIPRSLSLFLPRSFPFFPYFIFLLSFTRREKNYFERIKKQQALNERRYPTQEHLSCYERQKTNQKLERIIVEELLLLKCCLLIRLLFRSIELIETRQRMPSSVNKEKKSTFNIGEKSRKNKKTKDIHAINRNGNICFNSKEQLKSFQLSVSN